VLEAALYRRELNTTNEAELIQTLRYGNEDEFFEFIAKFVGRFSFVNGQVLWRRRVVFVDNAMQGNAISLSNFASLFAAYQIDGRLMVQDTNDALDRWISRGPHTMEGLRTFLSNKQLHDIRRVFGEDFLAELCLYVSTNHKIINNDNAAVNDSLAGLSLAERDYVLRHANMMPHHTQICPMLSELFAALQQGLNGDAVELYTVSGVCSY